MEIKIHTLHWLFPMEFIWVKFSFIYLFIYPSRNRKPRTAYFIDHVEWKRHVFCHKWSSLWSFPCPRFPCSRQNCPHIFFWLFQAPGASNSILRIKTHDAVTYPDVWKDTCVVTFTAPILPNQITGTKEFKFGSHSLGSGFKNFPGAIWKRLDNTSRPTRRNQNMEYRTKCHSDG